MFLLPLLGSLVMAGAGCVALAAIAATVQAQLPAVRKLLADSRTIAADRDFLIRITAVTAAAAPRQAGRPRRLPARGLRVAPVVPVRTLRAAA
jgi:hypothetical protein